MLTFQRVSVYFLFTKARRPLRGIVQRRFYQRHAETEKKNIPRTHKLNFEHDIKYIQRRRLSQTLLRFGRE